MPGSSPETIGIPHGNDGDTLLVPGLVGIAIAHKAALGQQFDLGHLRFEGQGRDKVGWAWHLRRGMQAIHGDTQPYHVEVALRLGQDGGRVCGVNLGKLDPCFRQGGQYLPEAASLPACVLGIAVSHRKMGKDALEHQVRQRSQLLDEG